MSGAWSTRGIVDVFIIYHISSGHHKATFVERLSFFFFF